MSDDSDLGNTVQSRVMATQIARAAIAEYVLEHPTKPEASATSVFLKWGAGILAILVAGGLAASASWVVNSIAEMKDTLTRLDERIQNGAVKDSRYDDLDRRVTTLEGYHKGNGQ